MISTEEIFRLIRGQVAIAEPLAPYTSLKIGGTADFLVKPVDIADLCRSVNFFKERNYPFLIIGRGTNLLVHDNGYRGAVIATQFLNRYTIEGEIVEAEAGTPLPLLSEKTFRESLGGLELLQGIPGSVGGAIRMNAGAYGQEISDRLEWVEILRKGRVKRIKKTELTFSYRSSGIDGDVVLRAGFRLTKLSGSAKQVSTQKIALARQQRAMSQPLVYPNAGSVFKNPGARQPETGLTAGSMIDNCGLRGQRCGGASVSDIHANFIVNDGSACSGDVLELIRIARGVVKSKYGISLDLEITLVGFKMTDTDGHFCP